MNSRDFSNRIENIDDRLIHQAMEVPNYRKTRQTAMIRRIAMLAAVIALMAASFGVGAATFAKETIVEVPTEQEILELSDIGLSLILPDTWKGKYALETNEFGAYRVYSPQIRAAFDRTYGGESNAGMLFYIVKWNQQLTETQWRDPNGEWNFAGNRYIMATADGTYLLYYASDVQCTPDTLEDYQKMEAEISDIRFVVSVNSEISYALNEHGQTYGNMDPDQSPEIQEAPQLIAAIGIDGTSGYVYYDDLQGELPQNPEEALVYMERLNEQIAEARKRGDQYLRYIPLYESDGKTVIGSFGISIPTQTGIVENPKPNG